jgi:hypothetical protein
MTYLDCLLRFFRREEYLNRENVAIIISNIFEQSPTISIDDFKKKIRALKSDFFRINGLNRGIFAEKVFGILKDELRNNPENESKFNQAKTFISKNFETSFNRSENIEFRRQLIEQFSGIKKPHEKLMESMNELLDKVSVSFSVDLHGVKEFSGIDIAKDIKDAVIGIQIKTRNDNISENMILSEVTRAQNYCINGFVLVYGRKMTKKVQSSIGGAFHIFKRLNDNKKIYSAIVEPELLAELFRIYSIDF